MAEVRGSSPLGSTSLFLLFAGKNLRESCRSRTLLVALRSNAARAEARTRLLHWPPSGASIVAFALGYGLECSRLHRQKPSYQPAQCITIHRRNMLFHPAQREGPQERSMRTREVSMQDPAY